MRTDRVFHAVDSHTEGMPTRVITGGIGVLPGATMNDKRLHVMNELDDLRTLAETDADAFAESLASENASRLAAMQAAENNIEEKIDELHARYHQRRQAAVTEELLDVISGFEALEKE